MNLNTSILKYIEDVKSGTFTVEEFTAETLQRIKDVDSDVHAYLSLYDSALNDAKLIDQKISSAWAKAMNDPYPKQDSTLNHVYATNNNKS